MPESPPSSRADYRVCHRLALFPLALHGGPLWKPLCYAQIGGLLLATVVTKLQVPVMYAIFVLDLKILKWDTAAEPHPSSPPPALTV